MIINYGQTKNTHSYIVDKVTQLKASNLSYKVVDIGGVAGGGWTKDIVDMTIDKNTSTSLTSLQIDVCDYTQWSAVLKDVATNGMYDYAICTHTLEDLYNPFVTLDFLPKIAKAGVITMPSITTELSIIENSNWIGYIHHRWIFDVVDNTMLVIPKLPVLNSISKNKIAFAPSSEEIIYEWDGNIPYKIFMDNYLGPTANTVIAEYQQVIDRHVRKQL